MNIKTIKPLLYILVLSWSVHALAASFTSNFYDITRRSGGETRTVQALGKEANKLLITVSRSEVEIHNITITSESGHHLSLRELLYTDKNNEQFGNGHLHYIEDNSKSVPTHILLEFGMMNVAKVTMTMESWYSMSDVKINVGIGNLVAEHLNGEYKPPIYRNCRTSEIRVTEQEIQHCYNVKQELLSEKSLLNGELQQINDQIYIKNEPVRVCESNLSSLKGELSSIEQKTQQLKQQTKQKRQKLKQLKEDFAYVRDFPSHWECFAQSNRGHKFWGKGRTPGKALQKAITKCAQSDGGGAADTEGKVRSACGDKRWRKNIGCSYTHDVQPPSKITPPALRVVAAKPAVKPAAKPKKKPATATKPEKKPKKKIKEKTGKNTKKKKKNSKAKSPKQPRG